MVGGSEKICGGRPPVALAAQSALLLLRSRTTEAHSLNERSSAAFDGNGSSIDK